MLMVFPIPRSLGDTHSFTSSSDISNTTEGKLATGERANIIQCVGETWFATTCTVYSTCTMYMYIVIWIHCMYYNVHVHVLYMVYMYTVHCIHVCTCYNEHYTCTCTCICTVCTKNMHCNHQCLTHLQCTCTIHTHMCNTWNDKIFSLYTCNSVGVAKSKQAKYVQCMSRTNIETSYQIVPPPPQFQT